MRVFDVKQAFDFCQVLAVARAMYDVDVHPVSICAFVREQIDQVLAPNLQGVSCEPTPWEGILKQGGKEAPFAWQLITKHIFHLLHEAWIQVEDYGIWMRESVCITHLCWSDNVFVFAKTPDALQAMLQGLTSVMAARNLRWKSSEMYFLCGGRNDGLPASHH